MTTSSGSVLELSGVSKDYRGLRPLRIASLTVRSGEHIAKALAAGADFCLVGRAMMYAISALGTRGAKLAVEILGDELSRTLAQIGYVDIPSLKAAAPIIKTR